MHNFEVRRARVNGQGPVRQVIATRPTLAAAEALAGALERRNGRPYIVCARDGRQIP